MSEFVEQLGEENPGALLIDGLDEAIVGIGRRCGMPSVAIYDYLQCVSIFQDQGMNFEEAVEWMEFNVVGSYVGENAPIILDTAYASFVPD